ncbi:MAG: LytTR family DNA-binding domain-containing protein [Nonlabens sp.]
MNYIIVDDEPLAHKIILSYADAMDELKLVGQAHSAKEALSLMKSETVDLLFLDIEMPKLKGIDLLSTLNKKPMVIFTTAYEQYALKGYELDAVDYLLKPFSLERFLKAVNKAYALWNNGSKQLTGHRTEVKPSNSIYIKSDKNIHQLKLDDILYLESDQGYVKVHQMEGKSVLSSLSLQEFEEKLSEDFIRIHKSYIIALSQLEKVEGNRVVIKAQKLPIGRHYKKQLLQRLGHG